MSPGNAIKVLLTFPLNLSLTQQENTHSHWVRLASSQALGLFSEKTKGYMAYHRKVIYNPSNIQLQRTKSQANWNGVVEQQLVEKPPVRPLAPRRKTPGQLYPINNGPPGKTN